MKSEESEGEAPGRPESAGEEESLQEAYREALHAFVHRPYVTGVTIGPRMRDRKYLDETAIRIHVVEKIPKEYLGKVDRFPAELCGVPVDVIQRIYRPQISLEERRLRYGCVDPIQPGVGIGRLDTSPGTLGLIAFERATGAPGLLSAGHVLAGPGVARPGDPILQPSPRARGRVERHTIAELCEFDLDARADAAYARFVAPRRVNPKAFGTGVAIRAARQAQRGDVLTKSSLSTGVTRGRVESLGSVKITYGKEFAVRECLVRGFEIRTLQEGNPDREEISDDGDSGAVWFDAETGEGVGLHLAGEPFTAPRSEEHALACYLTDVLERFDVSLEVPGNGAGLNLTDEEARASPIA